MSSIGGSDSSNDSEVRRLREQYKQREAELIKKHNKEVRNLTETNQAEVERIREQNEARVRDMRDKARETISRRDAQYQEQMNRMRQMQTQQLERVLKSNETKLETLKDVSRREIKAARNSNEDQVKSLNQKYRENVEMNRENFERQVDDMREDQKRSITKFKENVNEKHEDTYERQKDHYEGRVVDLKNELRNTRRSSRDRIRNQEINHQRTKMRMQDTFMDEVKRRDVTARDMTETQRKGFQESLAEVRQRARIANEKAMQAANNQHDQLKSDVLGRMNDRETRLERKVTDLKHQNAQDRIRFSQDAKSEVKMWQKAYDEKFDRMEQARVALLNEQNEINSEDIKKVRKEATEVIQANNRYMQNQLDTEVFRSKEALEAQDREYKLRTDYHKDRADSRIEKIRTEDAENDARQYENYERNIEELKRGHEKEVAQLRLNMQKDKSDAILGMKSRIQKVQAESDRKLEETISRYEKRLADLNDQFTREKRLFANREKQLMEELKRASDMEKNTLQTQYEEKHQKTVAQHNDEKRKMAIKHKEQIDNIMSQVRNS